MKILLTGGTGFIGKWIIELLSEKHQLTIVGRNESVKVFPEEDISVSYLSTDYSIDSLSRHMKNIDAVVHLAAKRVPLGAKGETIEDYTGNMLVSSNLFEVCKREGIKNIINISSKAVYSSNNALPCSENDTPKPLNFYGLSKLMIEQLADYYNTKYGMNIKSLRLAQVLGVGEREGFMLMTFINKALRKEELSLWGKGEGKRDYIYVKDVVDAIDFALAEPNQKGVFNIGSGTNVSHKELAETINKVFENTGNITFLSDKAEDKSVDIMDISKAKECLNWIPNWNLEDALYDMKKILIG